MTEEPRDYPIWLQKVMPLLRRRVIRVSGLERLPKQGPYIIASNHIGSYDPPLTIASLHKQIGQMMYFVTEQFVVKLFGLDRAMEKFGMIPKFDKRKSDCLDVALEHLKKGRIVGIYTEGVRNSGPVLMRGRTGTARLALWSKVPVYPIGFVGPQTFTTREAIRNWFFGMHPKPEVHVGEPLLFPEYYDQTITYDMLRDVTARIMRSIAPLAKKTYPF